MRTRKCLAQNYKSVSQLQAILMELETKEINYGICSTMKSATDVSEMDTHTCSTETHTHCVGCESFNQILAEMNKNMDLSSLQKVMANFMKESDKLKIAGETMEDAIDDTFEDEEEEEELVIDQILDSIKADISGQVHTIHMVIFCLSVCVSFNASPPSVVLF